MAILKTKSQQSNGVPKEKTLKNNSQDGMVNASTLTKTTNTNNKSTKSKSKSKFLENDLENSKDKTSVTKSTKTKSKTQNGMMDQNKKKKGQSSPPSSAASKIAKSQQNLAYFLIFFGFLDTVGVCAVIMHLVPRISSIGASPILAGLITALYGGFQFFSSTIFGKLGDKADKKLILLVTLAVSAASYHLLGYRSLVTFSIARIILGSFKHTQLMAQSYLTAIVPESKKSDYFGYFGGGIGLGFIVGPTIAGHLAEFPDGGFPAMTNFATAIFLINALLIWVFLPNSPKKNTTTKDNDNKKVNNKQKSKKTSKSNDQSVGVTHVWDILLLELLSELAVVIYFNDFVGIINDKYALPPKNLGYMISMISVGGMVMAMLSGKLNRLAGKLYLPITMSLVFGSLCSVSRVPSYWVLIASLFILFGSLALLRSIWPSMLTSRFSSDKASSAVGMSNSVMAVSNMMAPVLSGVATEAANDKIGAVLLAAAISSLGAIGTLWLPRSKDTPKTKKS